MSFQGSSFRIITGSSISDEQGTTTASALETIFDVGVITTDSDDPTSFFISSSTGTDDNFIYLKGGSRKIGINTKNPSSSLDVGTGSISVATVATKPSGGKALTVGEGGMFFYETTQIDPDNDDYAENKHKVGIRIQDGSSNLMMEVSSSGGYTSSFYISQSGDIGFNTDDPQSAFDAVVDTAQFQRPGTRKGLKINQEGNIESFDRDVNSAATGSEFVLKYSRGVTINQASLDALGISVGSDAAATEHFNALRSSEQNSILEKLELLGFIAPPQAGDVLGQIRFVAESGSIGDFDERAAGATAAIKAVVSEGASEGISSDLIFSVANKAGAAEADRFGSKRTSATDAEAAMLTVAAAFLSFIE